MSTTELDSENSTTNRRFRNEAYISEDTIRKIVIEEIRKRDMVTEIVREEMAKESEEKQRKVPNVLNLSGIVKDGGGCTLV